jgi:hypothetical protein
MMKGFDVSEMFLVDFDYQIRTLWRGTRPKQTLRRCRAAIEVVTAAASDMSVAYRVQLQSGRYPVLRYKGRLWRPLADRKSHKGPQDFLHDLRAGAQRRIDKRC